MIDPGAAGQALLDALVAQFQAADVTLPGRVGLLPGNAVAWDGELFGVSFGMLSRGQPFAPATMQTPPLLPGQTILFYEFHVTILRGVASLGGRGGQGGFPSPEKLAADFSKLGVDAATLDRALTNLHVGGVIVDVGIPFGYGPVEPIGPEGTLAGTICPVTFQAGTKLDPAAADGIAY